MNGPATASIAILAGLCLAALAGTQEPTEDIESFAERVEVEVVEVEVRITDRKGRPVSGLDRQDFRLFEDGRPVEVAYFSEYRDGTVTPGEAGGKDPGTAPPAETGEAPAPVAPGAFGGPTRLVIFLDQVHLEPAGRSRVLEGLAEFVSRDLPPDVPVMVVSYDGGVRISQDFTTDRLPVLDALAAQEESAVGVFELAGRRNALRRIEHIYLKWKDAPFCSEPCECGFFEMEAAARERASEVAAGVEQTLGGVTSVVAALGGVPGRKVLLLVSDGLEARPGLDLFHYISDVCPQHEQEVSKNYTTGETALSAIHDLTSDSSANRVTLYTLEAAGLRGDAADMSVGSSQFRPSLLTQRMFTGNLQHSLFVLAEQTGGKAVFNTNRFDEALEDVGEDQGTYYSLGYHPGHAGDGRVHLLRVEVEAPSYQLRYRRSYRDKPFEMRIAEGALASLLFGVGDNPLGVRAETGEATSLPGGGHRVPVRIWVPLAGLTLVPDELGLEGRLRVVMAVTEPDGSLGPVRQKLVSVEVAAANGGTRASEQLVEVTLELSGDAHVLALAVRDEIGGETSYLRHELRLGATAQTRLER
jgi:VWFA-related protein